MPFFSEVRNHTRNGSFFGTVRAFLIPQLPDRVGVRSSQPASKSLLLGGNVVAQRAITLPTSKFLLLGGNVVAQRAITLPASKSLLLGGNVVAQRAITLFNL